MRHRHDELAPPERLLAFSDAVVAIAMTLLILPLMESVAETAAEHGTVAEWAEAQAAGLAGFVMSFILIAQFWMAHHAMFNNVTAVDRRLRLLTIAWLFFIVWMPVATALTTALPSDAANLTTYVGSLFLTSLMLTAARWHLVGHPELHDADRRAMLTGAIMGTTISVLYLTALVIALSVGSSLGYFALALLMLAIPASRIVRRRMDARFGPVDPAEGNATGSGDAPPES